MIRWLLLVACAVMIAASPLLEADLDVTVPPGLPPEWIRFLPTPMLTDLGKIPGARRVSGQGSIESVPQRKRPRFDGGAETSFGFSGITTIDLPQHFTWSAPRPTKRRPGPTLTGRGTVGIPASWRFPPPMPVHLYWLALATMLRKAIHPALINRTATIEYLVLLGEPAYMAADGARAEPGLRPMALLIKKYVGPPSAARPLPSGGKTPYEKLIHKLALVELASGYPYSPDRRFARRLMSLSSEGLLPVLHYTRHPHPLVRRNAVALLGKYTGAIASARLRTLLKDKDRVVRNRALQALTDRADTTVVPLLIAALKSSDAGLRVQAASALGLIGDRRALKPLVAFVSSHRKDSDALWSAIPAIGRLAIHKDKPVLKLLWLLESQLRKDKHLFGKQTPIYPPPAPDKLTTAGVIAEMCLIARAGLGHQTARRAFTELIRGNKPLSKLSPANRFFACEMLRRMGPAGNQRLVEVIADQTAEVAIRAHALGSLDGASLWTFLELPDKLAAMALNSDSALIRARALMQLEQIDEKLAIRTARQIVASYAQGQADFKAMRKNWVVIPAMRLLGRYATSNIGLLQRVVRRASQEQQEGEDRHKKIGPKAILANPASVPVVTVPPILQTALLELGRTAKDKVLPFLLARLADTRALGRAEAALALGAIGGKKVIARLIGALGDRDPWIRFCAYRSLRRLTQADHFCDWLFGSRQQIGKAIAQWKKWWRDKYK